MDIGSFMKNNIHSTALINNDFNYFVDQFEDIRVLRYKLPGFESLAPKQKELIYYLSQAALSGRDILWDQNFRLNMKIRKTIEAVLYDYSGDKTCEEYKAFLVYAKRVFFSNGIHHHYSNDKFKPGFSAKYFGNLIKGTDKHKLPLEINQTVNQLILLISPVIFDDNLFRRKVEQRSGADMVSESSINFYYDVNQKEVELFYAGKTDPSDPKPVSVGLNSRVTKKKGKVVEEVYRSGGLYSKAIDQIVLWLEKAIAVSESDLQKKELGLLIDYYNTGDLSKWDDFNVAWVQNNSPEVDYNNGFIETYSDPLGMKATWEAIVNYNDIGGTKRISAITANAQWFEDNSPAPDRYKKEQVTGVAARVINIAMLGGDCYPVSPLGINLPNANWIRKHIGSKSVRLSNIADAYDITSMGNGFLEEFAADKSEVTRTKKYGPMADALHTDLHECVGHASGKLAEGTDPTALKNYSSALEEARADLFALYFMPDQKILELGLLPNEEAAKASYDAYLRNGILTQMVRIKPGKNIEEAHMRNRAAISHWVYEKGRKENVAELFKKDGKSFIKINDYLKLRNLFGELLREIQRIKSEGDYKEGRRIIENFGVKVDPVLHSEILERYKNLNLAPYTGFVNPDLIPVYDPDGRMTDVKVEYVNDFLGQMMEYGRKYSFL
jgi:dipeptidyl-peptidase III